MRGSDEKREALAVEVNDLTVGYGKKVIASGIEFAMRKGEVAALIGRNGVGKSTLMKTLCRELPALQGEVLYGGKEIRKFRRRDLAREISIVTTDAIPAQGLTVEELVAMGRQPHTGFTGRLDADDRRIVAESMEGVGIIHKRASLIGELSDGERQKAMIARALAQETPVMLLDEPFSFLDVASRVEIFALLKGIAVERERAVLLSSHDVAQALRMADRLGVFMADGRFIWGSPDLLIEQGEVGRMFGEKRNVTFDKSLQDFVITEEG